MEDLTLALITLTSFVLLFVVAIFADRAGAEMDELAVVGGESGVVPMDDVASSRVLASSIDADVA